MGHFLPWKTLPDCKADGDGWVEVTTTGRGTGDDGECNADTESPSYLEERAKCCEPEIFFGDLREAATDGETRDGRNTGENVEKDARGFCHTFTQDAWTRVLEVKLALRHWLGSDNMSAQVLLNSFCSTDLEIVGLQTPHVVAGHNGVWSWAGLFNPGVCRVSAREISSKSRKKLMMFHSRGKSQHSKINSNTRARAWSKMKTFPLTCILSNC